jgi:hypothetical protein
VLSVALAVALAGPSEDPPPLPIDLEWSAPPECPDRDAFVRMMEDVAKHELVLSGDAELEIDARVDMSAERYALRLALRSPQGEEVRELEAPACDDVVAAGSLVVATRLLAPAEDARVPSPPHDPPPVAAVPGIVDAPAVAAKPSRTPAPRSRARPRARAALGLLGGVAFGATPRTAGTLRAIVAVQWPAARLEVFAKHVFAQRRDETSAPALRAWITGAGALGCWSPAMRRLEIPVCGGIELAQLGGEGTGALGGSRVRTGLLVGLPIEAGVIWSPIRWLALRLLAGVSIGVRRPGFHLLDAGERVAIWRPWRVAPYALGGLEVRLP